MGQASELLNVWLLTVILALGVRTPGQEWFLFGLRGASEPLGRECERLLSNPGIQL